MAEWPRGWTSTPASTRDRSRSRDRDRRDRDRRRRAIDGVAIDGVFKTPIGLSFS
jgi:hypothetical protein